MSDAPSQTQDKFIVRLPDGMREAIRQRAEAAGRSMNAEVIVALERHLAGEPAGDLAQLVEDAVARALARRDAP